MSKAKLNPDEYKDEGCNSFSSCLRCPLDACKYDDPTALLRWRNQERDSEALHLLADGLSAKHVAKRMDISESAVRRIRTKAR